MAKRYHIYILLVIMGASIYTSAMVSPYNAAAITTLDRLESESSILRQDNLHFDVKLKNPEDIAVDQNDNIIYVANNDSDTVSVIDGDTMEALEVFVGDGPDSIAVDEMDNIAYVANSGSDTVSVIDGTGGNYRNIENITVGNEPGHIALDQYDNIIYVANSGSDTVSVINGTGGNYRNIKNITVGDSPRSIAVDHGGYGELNNIVYVANDDIADKDPGTVSVINGTGGNYRNIANNTVGNGPIDIAIRKSPYGTYIYVLNSGSKTVSEIDAPYGYGGPPYDKPYIDSITVGSDPQSMAVNQNDNIIYVANSGSDTVSVIDGDTLKVSSVSVGDSPRSIAVDEMDNIAYVANDDSNTLSVISNTSQKVQARVSFDVNPFRAGDIECILYTGNKIKVPTNQYFYVDPRTQCTAQYNIGFQFSSWIENLGNNSSRTINASQGNWFTNTLDWLDSTFTGKPKATPATLSVTNHGNFTANFERAPPAIPPEYLASLFAVVASAFIGSWLTPSFIGWRKAKNRETN